jgi:hypothetical protein
MVLGTKVIFWMVRCMERVPIPGLTVVFIKVPFGTISDTGQVLFVGLTETSM